MTDLSGSELRGYQLREQLGAGGFGVVYRAYQPAIEREVAIKIILPRVASKVDFIRRFEAEAHVIARLEHFHIVTLYDYWRDPDGAYLIMRYLRGGSMRGRLAHGPIELPLFGQMVEQIGSALMVAHQNNVIHRDMKPDNILLDEGGNTYLADFGIAKSAEHDTRTSDPESAVLGSPVYIPPEQIQGQPVTAQSDIYSFGITLFELLTGRVPFKDDNISNLLLKHLTDPVPDLYDFRPDLPPMFNTIIHRALEKDPNHRYETMRELVLHMREAMRQVLGDAESSQVRARASFRSELLDGKSVTSDIVKTVNPYKGLRAFEEADSADFFGRESLVVRLTERLLEDVPDARFLAVVGPSGSGKSSVVKAGLIPRLRDKSDASQWFIVEMVPGKNPLVELEATLLKVAVTPTKYLLRQLRASEDGLTRSLENILPEGEGQLLLLIDQFEELFTQVEEEATRAHFLALLMNALRAPATRLRVIVTLRADFYDKPLQYHKFGSLLRERTEIVLPLAPEDLERAIVGPAERVGLMLEPGLVATIIQDVTAQAGALPLLQYALTELFERRKGRVLSVAAYHESGGVLGALARRAAEIFDSLNVAEQKATRQMFLRLVNLGEGVEDTRRRVFRSELTSLGDKNVMEQVIDLYGKYRLLTFDNDPSSRLPTVEVAHEALIRQWLTLREWLDNNREHLRMQRRLAVSAGEWENAGYDSSYLADGLRLSQFEEFAQSTELALNKLEMDYLHASLEQRARLEAAEIARKAHEEDLERRARNRMRLLVGVMTAAAIISVSLAGMAVNSGMVASLERDNARRSEAQAERNAEDARSQALAAAVQLALRDNDTDLALVLALEAVKLPNPLPDVQRGLAEAAYAPGTHRLLTGHTGPVTGVTFNNSGTTAISASADNQIILWDLTTDTEIRRFRGHGEPVRAIAFVPDGSSILSGSDDYTMRLWNVVSGERILEFGGHGDSVLGVSISPDGLSAASASADTSIIRWDLTTGRPLARFAGHSGPVNAVQFSPNGHYLLSGSSDNSLILWDINAPLRDQYKERQYFGHSGPVLSLDYSPDGTKFVSGSDDNTLLLWDVNTGQILRRFIGHSDAVQTVTFSPDGTRILSGSLDGTLILWDVNSGTALDRFLGHRGGVLTAAFSPDGRLALSGSADNDLRIWYLHSGAELASYNTRNDTILSLGFQQDGATAITVGANNQAIVHNLQTQSIAYRLTLHEGRVRAAAIDADGTQALTGSDDTTIRLWNLQTGGQRRVFSGNATPIRVVAFNPKFPQAASGADDGSLILWNLETGEQIRRFGALQLNTAQGTIRVAHGGPVRAIAFNPNGNRIASGGQDRAVRLWDIESGLAVGSYQLHRDVVLSVAFSADGFFVLSGGADGDIIMWSIVSSTEYRRFSGHTGPIFSAQFSPSGKYILSTSGDNTLRVWEVASGNEIRRYQAHDGGVQVGIFSPGGTQMLSGGGDGLVRRWRVDYSLADLTAWIAANRYIRPLTCAERTLYRIEPLCEPLDIIGGS